MTQPPAMGAADPIKVVPRPRTVTGTPYLFAITRTSPISSSLRGVITAQGRKDNLLLSKDAAQHPRSEVSTDRPRRRFKARVALACLVTPYVSHNPRHSPISILPESPTLIPNVRNTNIRLAIKAGTALPAADAVNCRAGSPNPAFTVFSYSMAGFGDPALQSRILNVRRMSRSQYGKIPKVDRHSPDRFQC